MHFIPKKNLINLSFEVQLESGKRILSEHFPPLIYDVQKKIGFVDMNYRD